MTAPQPRTPPDTACWPPSPAVAVLRLTGICAVLGQQRAHHDPHAALARIRAYVHGELDAAMGADVWGEVDVMADWAAGGDTGV